MLVGNVITTSEIDDNNFYICNDLTDIKDGLPTLIVGWGKVKELYGDKVSILHKKISDNIYWTFSPTERKVDFDNDLNDFNKLCYNKIGIGVDYVYIDPIHEKKSTIKKILKKINSLKKPIFFIHNDRMVYIYGEGIIFGVDLEIIDFLGIDREKILNKIRSLKDCIYITNEIFNRYKDIIIKIDNKVRLLPYLIDLDDNYG